MTDTAQAPQPPAHLTPTADEGRRVLLLGNSNPHVQVRVRNEDGSDGPLIAVPAQHIDQSVTRVEFEAGVDDPDWVAHTLSTDNDRMLSLIARALPDADKRYAVAISQLEQILPTHSGGTKPAWVDGEDSGLAQAVGRFYGIPVGQPVALLTNNGRDVLHAQAFGTSAQPAAANYIALTANSSAAVATDTTLTGEIATGGGGLVRAQATYAHTTGTNTTTLTKTFTANGSDVLSVIIAKIGVFNATSGVTMLTETLLNSTATLNVSGDNVTVTETLTLG